jgi:hypothetical protein
VETFKDRGPIEFVNLVDITAANGSMLYRLSSHYLEFTDTINNRLEKMITEMLAPGFNSEIANVRHRSEVDQVMGQFHVSGRIDLSGPLNCLKLRCDPRSKTVSLEPFSPRSTRPQDYPSKLETTSEFLEYLSALIRTNRFITDIGDPFYISNYAWFKFLTSFLDERGIDLGRIQVNDDDPEEWDFINTEFDYESGFRS